MFKHYPISSGVDLYIRPTQQFKTVTILMQWDREFDETAAAHRAVLSNVLQDSSERYPTYTKYKNKLDELYGSTLITDVSKRENKHRFLLFSETVHERFVRSENHFAEWLTFLAETIQCPNVKDGKFDEATVRREKRSIVERIQSVYDDKDRYAYRQLIQMMRPNDYVSKSRLGTEELVKAVTPTTLAEHYDTMLKEDKLTIYVVGDIDEQLIIDTFRPIIQQREYEVIPTYAPTVPTVQDVQEKEEKNAIRQGKLNIGYSTPITLHDERFAAMQVANGILGGFAHSKLFQNVREKESMAYTISSSYVSQYGLLTISGGIDWSEKDKAVRLIDEQIAMMQRGEISDLELEQTKALLANSIRSALDTVRGQMILFDQYKEDYAKFSAQALIERWNAVTKDEVIAAIQTLKKEAIFLLKGEREDGED